MGKRKPLNFLISGFLDVPLTPKTNYVFFVNLLRHQDTANNPRSNSKSLNSYFGKLKFWKIVFGKCWKIEAPSYLSTSWIITDDLGTLVNLGK